MDRLEREALALAALGSPARLEVFRLLARHAPHPVAAGKIAEALGRRPNTLSVQVAALVRAGLVEGRRDGKSILYRVSPGRVAELVDWVAEDCCGGRPNLCNAEGARTAAPRALPPEGEPPLAVFLCSGNSARSVLAEAMLNQRAAGRMRAISAGARPKEALAPETATLLREMGMNPEEFTPKDWRTLDGEAAARPALAFTLCDRAADEDCRFWSGRPFLSHWPLPDPGAVQGEAAREAAFRNVAAAISEKVDALLALDPAAMSGAEFQTAIDRIGAAA